MHENKFGTKICSFIQACGKVRTAEQLKDLIRSELCELLPHEIAAYGVVTISDCRKSYFVNLGFPADYVRRIGAGIMQSSVVKGWCERREPEFYTIDDLQAFAPKDWVSAAIDNDIQNLAWHGVLDLASPLTTFFKFGRLQSVSTDEVKQLLLITVPHLHAALSHIVTDSNVKHKIAPYGKNEHAPAAVMSVSDGTRRLSAREAEVLLWLYHGKTNSEIADILSTSVFTAKNHVHNILMKLGAHNRTQAVSQALRAGLLSEVTFRRRQNGLFDSAKDPNRLGEEQGVYTSAFGRKQSKGE